MQQQRSTPPIFHEDPEPISFWNRPVILFILVFSLALTIRIAQFFFLRANDPSFNTIVPGIDSQYYDDLSKTILGGDWWLRSVPVHHMGPLYTYFLAAIYGIFGHHYLAVHALQYFLGASSSSIIYLAARQWFSNRVAFTAGLFPTLSATLVVYEGYLLPECLIFFLGSLFILVMGLTRRHPNRWWLWLLLGVTLGLPAIQRANFLLCAFAIALWIIFGFKDNDLRLRSKRLATFIFGIAITLAPITLHNRIIGGQWVPVTSNGGVNLYIGNGIEANGEFGSGCGETCTQYANEVSAGTTTWTKVLLNEIQQEPSRWLTLMLKKFYLYWAAYDPPDNFNYLLFKTFSPLTQAGQLPYYFVATLGFIGMIAAWPRRRFLMEIYLFIFICSVSVVLVFVSGRFRLMSMAPMSIFAGVAFWQFAAWIQSRQISRLAASFAGTATLLLLLNFYTIEPFPIRVNDYNMLAQYYVMTQKPESAISTMQECVQVFEAHPAGDDRLESTRKYGLPHCRGYLAKLLAKSERWQEAKDVLEPQVLATDYDERMTLMLIQAYVHLGKKAQAVTLAHKMLNNASDNPQWQAVVRIAETMPD